MVYYIPTQLKPSPVKNGLQVHKNEFGKFLHVAFTWQGLLRHSLISKERNRKKLK